MKHFLLFALLFCSTLIIAQDFELHAELRPRYENKHGYGSLFSKNDAAANFVSQRSRLNFKFKNENLRFGLTLQNVRVWGDVSTLSANDLSNSFHEAWGEVIATKNLSFKMGRQEIVYDDHRIFGNVAWAQQARSHDAVIAKLVLKENHKIDIGFALNADSQKATQGAYSNAAGYKSFQYLWYHSSFKDVGLSFLVLNKGQEFEDVDGALHTDFSQTIGPRLSFKRGRLAANAAYYAQIGQLNAADVNTSYYAADMELKVLNFLSVGLGLEHLSGKNMNDTSEDILSFNPVFGTNHKFNGWMDYFYVGNHGNSVGLDDYYGVLKFNVKKHTVKIIPHLFVAAADIYDLGNKMDPYLGSEIDLVITHKVNDDVSLSAGFSVMLATESMEILKAGDHEERQTWGWLMCTYKPVLFEKHTEKDLK